MVPDVAALIRATRSLRISQNRLQQSWKPRVDVGLAHDVAVFDAFFCGLDQAGFAQNPEMVRQRRFGHAGARHGFGAGHAVVVLLEQAFDDTQPHRVGECCQHSDLLRAQPDDTLLWYAHRAAMENGFERRMNGNSWTQPDDPETIDVMRNLSQRPIAALTGAELTASTKYLDGDPELACGAAIKKSRNLMAMHDGDAARARRILIANTARIDIVNVISKICRELNDGWSCS